jgi:hypothetical protein
MSGPPAVTLRMKAQDRANWRSTPFNEQMTGCTPNYAKLRQTTLENLPILHLVLHDDSDCR